MNNNKQNMFNVSFVVIKWTKSQNDFPYKWSLTIYRFFVQRIFWINSSVDEITSNPRIPSATTMKTEIETYPVYILCHPFTIKWWNAKSLLTIPSPRPMVNVVTVCVIRTGVKFWWMSKWKSCIAHTFFKQECIPVGCVPAARRPYAGVCSPGGVCLVLGGLPALGGCLPGPGGCLPGLEGCLPVNVGSAWLGGCLPGLGGVCLVWHPSMHWDRHPPPLWTDTHL